MCSCNNIEDKIKIKKKTPLIITPHTYKQTHTTLKLTSRLLISNSAASWEPYLYTNLTGKFFTLFLICISHFYHIHLHTQKKQIIYVANRDENRREPACHLYMLVYYILAVRPYRSITIHETFNTGITKLW